MAAWSHRHPRKSLFVFFKPLEKAKIYAHYVVHMKNQTEPMQRIHATLHSTDLLFWFAAKSESLSLFYIPTNKHGRHLVKKVSLCSSTFGPSARDRTRAGYKDMRQENIFQPTQFSLHIRQLEATPERSFCFFQPLEKANVYISIT